MLTLDRVFHKRRRLLRPRGLQGDIRLPREQPRYPGPLRVRHGRLPPRQHRHRERLRRPRDMRGGRRQLPRARHRAHPHRGRRRRRPLHRGRRRDLDAALRRHDSLHEPLGLHEELHGRGGRALPRLPRQDAQGEPAQGRVLPPERREPAARRKEGPRQESCAAPTSGTASPIARTGPSSCRPSRT